jgi:hypothetical protein
MTRESVHRNQQPEKRPQLSINRDLQRRAVSSVPEKKAEQDVRESQRSGSANCTYYSFLNTPLLVEPMPAIQRKENNYSAYQSIQVDTDCYSDHLLQRTIKEPNEELRLEQKSNYCSCALGTVNGCLADHSSNPSPSQTYAAQRKRLTDTKFANGQPLQRMEVTKKEIPEEIVDDEALGLTEPNKTCPGLPMKAKVLIISEALASNERLSGEGKKYKKGEKEVEELHRSIFLGLNPNKQQQNTVMKMKEEKDIVTKEWNWLDKEGPWIKGEYDLIIARSMICACDREEHTEEGLYDVSGKFTIKSTCGGIGKSDRVPVLTRVANLLSTNPGARAILTNSPKKGDEAKLLHPYGLDYWKGAILDFNENSKGFKAKIVKTTNTVDWHMGFFGIEIRRESEK